MLTTTTAGTERELFSARLRQSLAKANVSDDSPTQLQRHMSVRGVRVTVHGARKWLLGESIPTQDKLQSLAAWLGVDPNWLRFGVGDGNQANADAALTPRSLRVLEGFERLAERDQQLVQAMIDNMLRSGGAAC